jgi:hypothetical protein
MRRVGLREEIENSGSDGIFLFVGLADRRFLCCIADTRGNGTGKRIDYFRLGKSREGQ